MDWFDGQPRQPVSRRINASVFYDSTANWLKYIRGSASGAVSCQAARAREQNRQESQRHRIGDVHELRTGAGRESSSRDVIRLSQRLAARTSVEGRQRRIIAYGGGGGFWEVRF